MPALLLKTKTIISELLSQKILDESHLELLLEGANLFSLLPREKVQKACEVLESLGLDGEEEGGGLEEWRRYEVIRNDVDYLLLFRLKEGDTILLTWRFPYEPLLGYLNEEGIVPTEILFFCPSKRGWVLRELGLKEVVQNEPPGGTTLANGGDKNSPSPGLANVSDKTFPSFGLPSEGFIPSVHDLPPIDPSVAKVLSKELAKRFRILVLGRVEKRRSSPSPLTPITSWPGIA